MTTDIHVKPGQIWADEPTLCFVDVESTGLSPHRGHALWELAVIVRRPGVGQDDEYLWQIRPDLDAADPEALEMNGFHSRFRVPDGCDAVRVMDDGGLWKLPLHEALFDIQVVLHDAYLVGAVPSFDAAMLSSLLVSHDRRVPWRHRLVCVENLAAAVLGEPVPQGLRHAATALGVEVDEAGRHTAMGDARLAMAVYDAVMFREPAPATVGGTDG